MLVGDKLSPFIKITLWGGGDYKNADIPIRESLKKEAKWLCLYFSLKMDVESSLYNTYKKVKSS